MEYPVNYDSPSELKEFLDKHDLGMKKSFGQNFLVNRGAREKIISLLPLQNSSRIWEIGPGIGAMTFHLLQHEVDLAVFEIDHGFIDILSVFYGKFHNFDIIEGDFLKIFKKLRKEKPPAPDFILGNLPYVTGSVMIAEIVKSEINPERMVFTLQREVGQRMAASPGEKDYSSFSLVCQSKYDIFLRGILKPGSFYPRPEVNSVVVEMRAHGNFKPGLSSVYYSLIDDLFSARRKKISNNLARSSYSESFGKYFILESLKTAGISPDCRAETLSVKDVEQLSRIISKNIK